MAVMKKIDVVLLLAVIGLTFVGIIGLYRNPMPLVFSRHGQVPGYSLLSKIKDIFRTGPDTAAATGTATPKRVPSSFKVTAGSSWAELGGCGTFTTSSPLYAEWMAAPDIHGIDQNPFNAISQFQIFFKNDSIDHSIFSAVPQPEDIKYVVPNIQHYAWYSNYKANKTNLRFHHYMSILSSQKFNKPNCVYFWYEDEPTGKLWDLVKRNVRNLILVHRVGPTSIYGRKVNVPEHKSDVVRLEAVIKYGGIYTDLDVMILKPFTDLRVYDVTMGYESSGKGNTALCNGIMVTKPNATFLQIWHDKYRTFDDSNWGHHSVALPAILAKAHPNLIHTEKDTLNRPNYLERGYLYNKGMFWNWSRNYAIHLWFRFHNQEHNEEDIKDINTTMGQLFRYILYGKMELIKSNEIVTPYSP
ncbi:uncharacterized protein LOC135483079 [Lineus longissimus]|uniref:uncharacterized protein LOC135483079 n=1 Tax=Lineus longissimus TaxID=88925 RepID=UPI00315D31E4